MTLKLKKVSKYVNSLIKSKKGYDFPEWNLTKENSFWFALLCGVRGAGKTNAMLQIMNIEKKGMLTDDNIVYWVSPTHDAKVAEFADKYPDNMKFYDELNIKVFNEIVDEIRERTEEWKQTKFIFDLFERYLKDSDDKLGDDEVEILMKSGILDDDVDVKKMIDEFNFQHPPRATLVLDDSMGSPLISSSNSKQGKEFTRWAIRHRHDFTNLFILTQHFRGISKPLRTNANAVLLFPSKDRATSKSIFDEFSSVFGGKMENYLDCLDLLDGEKVGSFLFIYYDKDKFLRLGFNQDITFSSGGEPHPEEKDD
jgi:hypothetical protein